MSFALHSWYDLHFARSGEPPGSVNKKTKQTWNLKQTMKDRLSIKTKQTWNHIIEIMIWNKPWKPIYYGKSTNTAQFNRWGWCKLLEILRSLSISNLKMEWCTIRSMMIRPLRVIWIDQHKQVKFSHRWCGIVWISPEVLAECYSFVSLAHTTVIINQRIYRCFMCFFL